MLKFTTSGCKDIGIEKFELAAKTKLQFVEIKLDFLFIWFPWKSTRFGRVMAEEFSSSEYKTLGKYIK